MTGRRPHPDPLGGAERRLAALEAELGEVQAGVAPRSHRVDPEASRLRQIPRSTWWLIAGAVLVVAAIVTAVV